MYRWFKRNVRKQENAISCFLLGDDNWYRAVVLEVGVSEAKVIYADYGNVEMLPFSRLLPITASYLELPPQIFKCSIAGRKPTICKVINDLICRVVSHNVVISSDNISSKHKKLLVLVIE